MTSASSPLLLAALEYIKRGWPVFPLWPREKTPLTKQGFKNASTDRNVVLAWWSQWPDANIGVATGHGFDVLDIDGEDGRAAFLHFLAENEGKGYVHAGPVAATGKGYHLLFAPTGEGNRARLLDAPLDFRGLGGYIVAPPSVHPNGHQYAWFRNEKADPAPVTPWLTTLLVPPFQRTAPRPTGIRRENGPDGLPVVIVTDTGKIAETRPDIVEVATDLGLQPRDRGRYYVVACPFHADDTPSMALYPDNKFYCYGCFAQGDSHDLTRKTDMHGRHFI